MQSGELATRTENQMQISKTNYNTRSATLLKHTNAHPSAAFTSALAAISSWHTLTVLT
jgi:hypothetical protein